MDAKVASLVSSLQVPCVQELAKELLKTVPCRYVRSDQEPPVTHNPFFANEVPVISLQNLISGDSTELQKLHCACKEWGFFQLIDHGVSSIVMEKMKGEIKELFELSMEEKKKLIRDPGDRQRRQGFWQHDLVVSNEQKLDWSDVFYIITLPVHMRKRDLFSKLRVSFRETMEAYSLEMNNIFMILLNQMAKALKVTRLEEITDVFEEVKQQMRLNHYPPCPQPDLVMGLTPHSDPGGLTILLQINEVEGLQIKKDGMWVPIKPLPNAFTVNVGDSLEILSNGIYRSIEHRATVNKDKERHSIATFHSPKINGHLCPAPTLVTAETPAQFQTISVADFYKGFFSRKLHGKSNLEILRIGTKEDPQN